MTARKTVLGAALALSIFALAGGGLGCGGSERGGETSRSTESGGGNGSGQVLAKAEAANVTYYFLPG